MMSPLYRVGMTEPVQRRGGGGFQAWFQERRRARTISTDEQNASPTAGSSIHQFNDRNDVVQLRLIGEVFEKKAPGKLFSFIIASRFDPSLAQAAANAISALVSKGYVFSDQDLSGVRIAEARIIGGIFERTILCGADLSNVNATNAIFRGARLDGAKIGGLELREFPTLNGHTQWPELCQFSTHADEPCLFSAGPRATEVVKYSMRTGAPQERYPLEHGLGGATDLAIAPGGSHFAIRSANGAVQVWNTHTKKTEVLMWESESLRDSRTGLAYSRDGIHLASFQEGGITVWNLNTKQRVDKTFSLHMLGKRGQIAYAHAENNPQASCWVVYADQKIRLFNVSDLEQRALYEFISQEERTSLTFYPSEQELPKRSNPHKMAFIAPEENSRYRLAQVMAVSRDGQWLAIASGSDAHHRLGKKESVIWLWRLSDLLSGITSPAWSKQLKGHTDTIFALSFSQNGQQLLSGAADGNLFVWDVQQEKLLTSYEGGTEAVGCVSFSQDGALVACCRRAPPGIETGDVKGVKDVGVRVFKMNASEESFLLGRHHARIESVHFFPDGKKIVSIDQNGGIYFREASRGDVMTATGLSEIQEQGALHGVCISFDGEWVAFGGEKATLWLYNTRIKRVSSALQGHTKEIRSVASSPVAPLIASAGMDGKVCLWDIDTEMLVHVFTPSVEKKLLEEDKLWFFEVAFSPDGRFLSAVTYPHVLERIYLWDLQSRALVRILPGDSTIAFSPCGQFLASFQRESCSICVWNLNTQEERHMTIPRATQWGRLCFWGNDYLIFGCVDGWMHLWKWKEGSHLGMQRLDSAILGLAVTQKGELLVGGGDKAVRLWTLMTPPAQELARLKWSSHHHSDWSGAQLSTVIGLSELNYTLLLQKGANLVPSSTILPDRNSLSLQCSVLTRTNAPIYALCLLRNGSFVGGVGENGQVMMWWPNGVIFKTLTVLNKRIAAITQLNSGELLIASNRKLYRYNSNGELLKQQSLNIGTLLSLYSGSYASGGYSDGTICIFDPDGTCRSRLMGHTAAITALTDLRDGRIASVSVDKTVKLWDIASGCCIQTFEGYSSDMISVLYMGEDLLITSEGNLLQLWNTSGRLLARSIASDAAVIVSLQQLSHNCFASVAQNGEITVWNRQGQRQYDVNSTETFSILSCIGDGGGGIISGNHAGTMYKYSTP